MSFSPNGRYLLAANEGEAVGVVNPPGNPHRHYQLLTRPAGGVTLTTDDWLATAPETQGSWWPAWMAWLQARSGKTTKPPRMGGGAYRPVADAPGSYVLEK